MTNYKLKKMLQLNEEIKEKEKEVKELKKLFDRYKEEFIKENEASEKVIYSKYTIYYKSVESKRLDSTRLKKENKEIYEKYIKSSNSIRFYIKEVLQ